VAGWQQNYYLRQIPVRIAIEGQDPRLIPDLSSCGDVLLDHKNDAVLAPLEAISAENGKMLAYVRDGAGFAAREVQLGERNNNHVAVLAGLNAGDEIALGRPATLEP
jgi:multidrug efflux pump subunit AcrA (membrane-fusion protein)